MRVLVGAVAVLLLVQGCAVSPPPDVYIVFFGDNAVVLSPEAKEVVDRAAAAVKGTGPAVVIVAGEPTTVVAPGFDPKLADPRFAAVEGALIAAGVNPKIMARASLTDIEAKVGPTGNRRIEIRLFKNR